MALSRIRTVWDFPSRRIFSSCWESAADRSTEAEAGSYAGAISGAARVVDGADHDAFVTDVSLPEGEALHGAWMIVAHGNGYTHGYEIDRVETQGARTVAILTMDHGLRINGNQTREVFFPQREFEGTNTFTIPLAFAAVDEH